MGSTFVSCRFVGINCGSVRIQLAVYRLSLRLPNVNRPLPATLLATSKRWDTFVKERSGGNGSVVGLPEQVVVAFAAG